MSGVPPNMPPGGGAPPPYDPQTQWRTYREQQKAAWRAQRYAWKAHARSMYGPRVPSVVGPIVLICVGVIALLVLSGHIDSGAFWTWYGQWWPLLLIGAGLALLGEWALDMRRATPVRRTGSFIGILVLLAIVGGIASVHNHFPGPFGGFGDNGFFNFGMPEHEMDQPTDTRTIPANASIEILNPRGDISITAGDQPTLQVEAHEIAYANSDRVAKKIFDQEAEHVTVSGNAVLIKSESNSRGKVNLTITVPKTAKVTVNSAQDNVTAAGLGAGIEVTARGDIHLSSIVGPVEAHFTNGRHDEFSAHDIQGDLTLDGDVNDLTLSEIKGTVTQNGNIEGDVHMETISGAVHLHTPVTDLELAELPGDLTLGNDDLRITEAKGPVHVVSHSKDIDLSEIYGDTYVEDRDGRIAVEPAGPFGVEARNNKGDVEVTLPSDDSATVSGRAHNGDIVTDFSFVVSGEEDKTVTGKIGSGSARIVLNTDNGDLHIRKGPTAAAMPSAAANVPNAQAGPHLKSKKALPQQPVAQ